MSKLFLLVVITLAVAGVLTGIIEVRINGERLRDLPATIQQSFGSGSLLSKAEYYFTTWKRKAEVAIANSDSKKFELHMKYVEKDTETLQGALDTKKDAETIIVWSKLLTESLSQAKESVEDISDEELAKVRDAWLKVLASANEQLARLSGVADEYKKYQEEIEKIAPASGPAPASELKF